MNKIFRLVLFILITIGSFPAAIGQSEFVDTLDKDTLPLDSSLKFGRLSNGMNYYIKTLPEDVPKIYMRLYVKAGYNHEDPDQVHLAHLLEHLAFRSTKHFPQGLHNEKELLNSINMGKYDINGTTGFRATEYIFDAPANNEKAIETGMHWFTDIMNGLELSGADIDIERGTLAQEVILRSGTNFLTNFSEQELYSRIFPCVESHPNFLEHLKAFPPESVRRFYREWYKPQRIAISVVGNIEGIDSMEKRIKDNFSQIKPEILLRENTDCDSIYYSSPSKFAAVEWKMDPSRIFPHRNVQFKLFFRDSIISKNDRWEGIKRIITWNLMTLIINNRFKEANKEYNSSYSMDGVNTYKYKDFASPLMVTISAEDKRGKEGIMKTMKILHQIKQFGATKEEWQLVKSNIHQSITGVQLDKPNYWLEEIRKNYVLGEALPKGKQEYLKQWVSGLDLQEFNDLVAQILKVPEDIGVMAPSGHKALALNEKKVRSWINEAFNVPVEPYILPKVPEALLNSSELFRLEKVGYIDKATAKSGARELVLENGLKVVLQSCRPSRGMNEDRIMLHGFTPKGARFFPPEDFSSAINAPNIVKNAGAGDKDKFEISRTISNTSFAQGINQYIDYQEAGVKGIASLEDLEEMLQLIYLYFVKPRKDLEAFEDWKKQERKIFQEQAGDFITMDLHNKIREITGDSSISGPPGLFGVRQFGGTKRFRSVEDTDRDRAYMIYEKLFGNAEDFTFLISGDFPIDSVIPLVQIYLGNLPNRSGAIDRKPPRSYAVPLPKGPVYKEIVVTDYNLEDVNYAIRYIQKAGDADDWQEEIKVQALGAITNEKAWGLRFDKGYSLYNVGVRGYLNKDMERYEIGFRLNFIPKEFPLIREDTKLLISELKSGAISERLFEDGLQRMYSIYNTNGRANEHSAIQQRMYEHYRYGSPWIEPSEKEQYLKSLTREDLIKTANKYYKNENLFEFVMKNQTRKN